VESTGNDVVRAAGGVPVRDGEDGIEVLVVHRPRYDDWTFPKGKREPGETDEECALREVREETGLECALGDELPSSSYVDGRGRPKVVRYWRVRVLSGEVVASDEADLARWVTPAHAVALLSYEPDQAVLRAVSGDI
jgi:8-oxo-dGTP diphosphatase